MAELGQNLVERMLHDEVDLLAQQLHLDLVAAGVRRWLLLLLLCQFLSLTCLELVHNLVDRSLHGADGLCDAGGFLLFVVAWSLLCCRVDLVDGTPDLLQVDLVELVTGRLVSA